MHEDFLLIRAADVCINAKELFNDEYSSYRKILNIAWMRSNSNSGIHVENNLKRYYRNRLEKTANMYVTWIFKVLFKFFQDVKSFFETIYYDSKKKL